MSFNLNVRMVVQPPPHLRAGLTHIAQMPAPEQEEFIAKLHATIADDFSEIAQAMAESKEQIEAAVFVMDALTSENARPDDDAWVEGLVWWVFTEGQSDKDDPDLARVSAAGGFLKRLLREEHSLWKVAKKLEVVSSQPFRVNSSQIHTDLRPVFYRDPTRPPFAWVVIHTLRVRTSAAEGEVDHILGFDEESLGALEEAIVRAREKSLSLARALRQGGLHDPFQQRGDDGGTRGE